MFFSAISASPRFSSAVAARADVEDARARRDAGVAAARRDASRDRTARSLASDYIVVRAAEDRGASRCPGRRTSCCRSSSPPAPRTADLELRSTEVGDSGVVSPPRRPRFARSPSPTTATSTGPVVFAGYGIVVPDEPGVRATTATPRSTSRTRSSSCCAISPRMRSRRRKAILAALRRPALQGDGRPAARREGDRSSSPGRSRRTPASWRR